MESVCVSACGLGGWLRRAAVVVGGVKAPWLYSSRWLEAKAKAEEATFKDFCLFVRSSPREQRENICHSPTSFMLSEGRNNQNHQFKGHLM